MSPLPPQSLEAILQLLADGQSTYINQTVKAEELRRRLSPMCYLDDDFGIKEIHDIPNSSASLSPRPIEINLNETIGVQDSASVSPSASVSTSPSPEATV